MYLEKSRNIVASLECIVHIRLLLILVLVFAFNFASAAANDDLDGLESLHTLMSDIGRDFIALSTRFRAAGEDVPFLLSNYFASETLIIGLEIEQIKDVIVGLSVLKCDEASRQYFRNVAAIRFGQHGIVPFLALRNRDIESWLTLSTDAALTEHANRLRAALRRVDDAMNRLRSTYAP